MDAPWYIRNKALFLREVEEMEKEGFVLSRDRLKERGEVAFDGNLSVGGKTHRVNIVYLRNFPFARPEVYLPDKKISGMDKHRTLRDGALCLRGYQPDEWDSEDHGVSLIPDIVRWIESDETGQWEYEHNAIDHMLFQALPSATIIIPDEMKQVQLQQRGRIAIKFNKENRVGFLSELVTNDQGVKSFIKAPHFFDGQTRSYHFFALPKPPLELARQFAEGFVEFGTFLKHIKDIMEYNEDVTVIGRSIHPRFNRRQERRHPSDDTFLVGLICPIANKLIWQFFLIRTGNIWHAVPVNTNFHSDFWNRTKSTLDLNILKNKSVAVIGLGSVGSTVALELAASGVGSLTLIDNDILTIGNICRHEASLRYLGKPKTIILKEIIQSKYFDIDVRLNEKNPLFNVLDSRDTVLSSLQDVDIVAVCIGSHNIHKYINSICLEADKPAVYGYVGPFSSAGRIIRVIPNETGCYNCVYAYLAQYPEIYFDMPTPSLDELNEYPIDYGCNTPAVPGTAFDTKTIALAQTRLIVQTLLRGIGSYQDDEKNVFLITNQKITAIPNSNPLWSQAWNIPQWEHCNYCNPKTELLTDEQSSKAKEILGLDAAK